MAGSDWDEKKIKEGLNTEVVGTRFEIFQEIDSTNHHAMELASGGVEEGTVVLAEWQTEGRGRLGREWVSPSGVGIYVTVILHPEGGIAQLPKYTLLAGVAVAEAVREVAGLPAEIKWPNDVLIDGKKFCGILEESFVSGSKIKYVIIGIGINVNTDPADLPVTPRGAPTSLKAEKGEHVDRVELLRSVLQKLDTGYTEIRTGNGENIIHKWRGLSATLGHKVRVELSGGTLEGQAVDIDDDGGLLISAEGGMQKVTAGDIIIVNS